MSDPRPTSAPGRVIALTAVVTAIAAIGLTALLVNIFERKQEARQPFVPRRGDHRRHGRPRRVGQELPAAVRPVPADGGSEAHALRRERGPGPRTPDEADPRTVVAQSRLEEDPRLKTMWNGYAFAVDFREERGHAYMLDDQTYTRAPAGDEAARARA